mgnify:CR=1 FL=1
MTESKVKTIGDVARLAMNKAGANRDAAICEAMQIIDGDKILFSALAHALVERAVEEVIGEAYRQANERAWRKPAAGKDDGAGRIMSMATVQGASLLEYRMGTCNKFLKDANAEDLDAERRMHAGQARGHAQKEKWFALIAEFMKKKGGATVGACLDDTDLRGLQMKCGV